MKIKAIAPGPWGGAGVEFERDKDELTKSEKYYLEKGVLVEIKPKPRAEHPRTVHKAKSKDDDTQELDMGREMHGEGKDKS